MDKTKLTTSIIILLVLGIIIFLGVFSYKHSKKESPTEIPSSTKEAETNIKPIPLDYIEIMDGCGPYYDTGVCVNVRSGPGTVHEKVARLRTGVVLKVEKKTFPDDSGVADREWYKINFEKNLRYPERVESGWYVAIDPESIRHFSDSSEGYLMSPSGKIITATAVDSNTTNKKIVVKRSEQMLYAYEDGELFMQQKISTGLELTPTPRGNFQVYKKTPSRYMQGPIPEVSDQYYDLPGVPWDLYFSGGGAVIHGAYWHDHFGEPWSHGCVNLPLDSAQRLYEWAPLGTPVIIQD